MLSFWRCVHVAHPKHQVWWRGVNDRKREVEEKAKQLEQVASLSALIAGFALVAMVEVSIPGKFRAPDESRGGGRHKPREYDGRGFSPAP